MGMFDYVKANKPVVSPCCKKSVDSFQTKDLDCQMITFFEGKNRTKIYAWRGMTSTEKKAFDKKHPDRGFYPLKDDKKKWHWNMYPAHRRIYAYDWCQECKVMIGQFFQFNNKGFMKRYKKPIKEKSI